MADELKKALDTIMAPGFHTATLTPTPVPAASERMTATLGIRGVTDEEMRTSVRERKWFGWSWEAIDHLLALVDKQAAELATADRAAKIENTKLVAPSLRCSAGLAVVPVDSSWRPVTIVGGNWISEGEWTAHITGWPTHWPMRIPSTLEVRIPALPPLASGGG